MVLKPSLVLKLGQQLKMTPQLQQAIRLLQLSSLELELEIQQALDSNLMLEEFDEETPEDEDWSEERTEELLDQASVDSVAEDTREQEDSAPQADEESPDEPVDIPNPELDGETVPDSHEELVAESVTEELPVDSVWEDVWEDPLGSPGPVYNEEESDDYLDSRNFEERTLADHLLDQINLLHISDTDRLIAMAIIDGLNADGVLTESIEEIWVGVQQSVEVDLDEVEAVLHLIQHLDPVGVASRDLRECLLIQLKELPGDTPWRDEAIDLVAEHLALLGSSDFAQLQRKTRLKEQELGEVIRLIQTLNPRPGSDIATTRIDAVEPDVIVSRERGRWRVELNPKTAPRIRVNPEYASLVRRADSSSDNLYLRNHLQEARWFIKSLQQRNETLLKVATKIVEYQRGFFEYGEEAMKPLVLHDIAEAVSLHESTISRVTTQKYMATPMGLFELKYFFSSHVGTQSGGEVSSTAIRALIKKLVSEENPRKPLSDSKIVSLLARQDIKVARRTIAKYREAMMIPPSNERKRLT